MGKMKSAWQAEKEETLMQFQPSLHKDNLTSRINDPYNLWDNDGHEAQAIDLNNWADMAE